MLTVVAFLIVIFVVLTLIYALLYVHDIPYRIAVKRNHPHQDAIKVAGLISLVLLHTIWPFLWIWATMYKPENQFGFQSGRSDAELRDRIAALEDQVAALKNQAQS